MSAFMSMVEPSERWMTRRSALGGPETGRGEIRGVQIQPSRRGTANAGGRERKDLVTEGEDALTWPGMTQHDEVGGASGPVLCPAGERHRAFPFREKPLRYWPE